MAGASENTAAVALNGDLENTVCKMHSASTIGVEADDAIIMHNASSFKKARLRIVALLITFLLEMIVCFVFSKYTDTFNKFPLLIAFQPVISAISGNVGLQSSSINVRGLAVGLADVRQIGKAVGPELRCSVILGIAMAAIAGCTALVWDKTEKDDNTWQGALAFAFAIGLGMFCSMLTAGLTGSAAPLLFKRCGFDPSAMAGPLETAFQDIIGGTVLLAIAAEILKTFGDSVTCGDLGDCLGICDVETVLGMYKNCVQTCVANACS